MNIIRRLKYYITYPYYWYKERKRIKSRIEQLKKQDPFIYK